MACLIWTGDAETKDTTPDLSKTEQIKTSDHIAVCGKHGEGNGTPLQDFCLENPMDGGAWWAAVHGVARVGHD